MKRVMVHKARNIDWWFPILGWTIMLCQGMWPWKKSSFSHMALEYDGYIYDVTFGGYAKSPKAEWLTRYKIVESHQFQDPVSEEKFVSWMQQFNGMEYDFLQIYGLFTKALRKVSVNTIGEDFMKMICSELALHYIMTFYDHKLLDSDAYDLHDTWSLVKRY